MSWPGSVMTATTAYRPRCGPATSPGRTAWLAGCRPAPCGSIPLPAWITTCLMAATSSRGGAGRTAGREWRPSPRSSRYLSGFDTDRRKQRPPCVGGRCLWEWCLPAEQCLVQVGQPGGFSVEHILGGQVRQVRVFEGRQPVGGFHFGDRRIPLLRHERLCLLGEGPVHPQLRGIRVGGAFKNAHLLSHGHIVFFHENDLDWHTLRLIDYSRG